MTERIEVSVNGTVYSVEIDDLGRLDGAPMEVRVNGRAYTVQIGKPAGDERAAATSEATLPQVQARPLPPAKKPAAAATPGRGQGHRVTAPMPGKILSVAVQAGDTVQAKDTLCTLEAMKMEMTIAAPSTGTVREVRTKVGESVVYGDLLFVLD